jgi:CDP-glucose 4,6-dehydratase
MHATAVVERVLRACGRPDLEPLILGTATHEILAQHLSSEKARRLLGWSPAYGLDHGFERTVAWYADHLGARLHAHAA